MIWIAGKNIGPHFPAELGAAGLLGLPFSWGSDGTFDFSDSMTTTKITAVQAVATAHNSTQPYNDTTGFLKALSAQVGGVVALSGLAAKYPGVMLLLRTIEAFQFTDARAILDDALAKAALTQVQHDGIIALAATYGITL